MAHFKFPPTDFIGGRRLLNTSNNTAWQTEGKRFFFKKQLFLPPPRKPRAEQA
jgi:hypothetical protein